MCFILKPYTVGIAGGLSWRYIGLIRPLVLLLILQYAGKIMDGWIFFVCVWENTYNRPHIVEDCLTLCWSNLQFCFDGLEISPFWGWIKEYSLLYSASLLSVVLSGRSLVSADKSCFPFRFRSFPPSNLFKRNALGLPWKLSRITPNVFEPPKKEKKKTGQWLKANHQSCVEKKLKCHTPAEIPLKAISY